MDVRQLEYLLAVVDEGGFTKAAATIHVSQPSLSQGVRSLERELGVELFHRLGREVRLTAAGEAVLGPARQVMRQLDVLRTVAAEVGAVESGRLDLVSLPTLAVDPLARLIGSFRTQHPRVSVRLIEPEDADAIGQLVRQGDAEVGLAELPLPGRDLVAVPLIDQDVLAVCPPGTKLGRRRTLAVARLAEMPIVATPPGTSTRRLVDRALASADIEPVVAVETSQREALLPLVLAGAGTSFLPAPMAAQAAAQGAVVAHLEPALRRRIGLVWRDGPLSPAARAFLDLARDHGDRSVRSERQSRRR